jgi:hypothetical protein
MIPIATAFQCDSPAMPEINDADSLPMPLFSVLDGIGWGTHKEHRYFETHTLFWSLSRLFGTFERTVNAAGKASSSRELLSMDIEYFIIRYRVALNDIAFVLRQLLPANVRHLPGPSGATAPDNREVSYRDLAKYFAKYPDQFPEFSVCFANADNWTNRMSKDREKIIHYKSRVMVFGDLCDSFAILDRASTEPMEQFPDGSRRVVLTSIYEFIVQQTRCLIDWMNNDLVNAIHCFAERTNLSSQTVGSMHRLIGPGISAFNQSLKME